MQKDAKQQIVMLAHHYSNSDSVVVLLHACMLEH